MAGQKVEIKDKFDDKAVVPETGEPVGGVIYWLDSGNNTWFERVGCNKDYP